MASRRNSRAFLQHHARHRHRQLVHDAHVLRHLEVRDLSGTEPDHVLRLQRGALVRRHPGADLALRAAPVLGRTLHEEEEDRRRSVVREGECLMRIIVGARRWRLVLQHGGIPAPIISTKRSAPFPFRAVHVLEGSVASQAGLTQLEMGPEHGLSCRPSSMATLVAGIPFGSPSRDTCDRGCPGLG